MREKELSVSVGFLQQYESQFCFFVRFIHNQKIGHLLFSFSRKHWDKVILLDFEILFALQISSPEEKKTVETFSS